MSLLKQSLIDGYIEVFESTLDKTNADCRDGNYDKETILIVARQSARYFLKDDEQQ